ncbi:hypothetical protein ES703_59688 [subsurface metagenome]
MVIHFYGYGDYIFIFFWYFQGVMFSGPKMKGVGINPESVQFAYTNRRCSQKSSRSLNYLRHIARVRYKIRLIGDGLLCPTIGKK